MKNRLVTQSANGHITIAQFPVNANAANTRAAYYHATPASRQRLSQALGKPQVEYSGTQVWRNV